MFPFVPLLNAIGFTAVGPAAGSIAAGIQSFIGGAVAAGSPLAIMQSAAMGGYGVAILDGCVAVGVAAGAGIGTLLYLLNRGDDDDDDDEAAAAMVVT